MKTLLLGLLIFTGVIVLSLGDQKVETYLQWHSIILVIIGSFSILLLSTSPHVFKSVAKACLDTVKPDQSFDRYKADLVHLSQNKKNPGVSQSELITYASELWASGVEADLFIVLLSQKRKEIESKYSDAVQAIKNLAKYPPALGMIGTVMGMISLFSHLDANKENIGASLSLAMTATFFGLLLTNGIISPLGDRMHVKQIHEQRCLDAIYEILLLINRDEPSSLISEEVDERAS